MGSASSVQKPKSSNVQQPKFTKEEMEHFQKFVTEFYKTHKSPQAYDQYMVVLQDMKDQADAENHWYKVCMNSAIVSS